MPDHVFDGAYLTTYPESKDAQGRNLGTVQPGEIRDTDGPLDHQWREATDEDRARWAAIQAQRAAGDGPEPAAPDAGDQEPPGEPEVPAPDGPQPAPPAVIPGT